jgi:Holliday junction resolvasome RuvABC ATP-dependent DNA helicase subunit
MKDNGAFVGRAMEIVQLRRLYVQRKHVLIVGPAGIGNTELLRQVSQTCLMLRCEETSSLQRICARQQSPSLLLHKSG